ncbi:zinc finger CCCH domain-containing protein 5 isoform X3 [Benincasa hispida]|uniref:zinc finger CCCH domain-containing protein 5 isoform X3 n=1 Tax=Benincasa hispida TaxID=102211 RepID=UPI0018FF31DD|nr:zinc finger CCCH domain-containing protein 5 isoform X3 [Benincasa hispida]XP_038905964.1 zinc finger CCCH domain-containing protein 5 isoform X3 [Benincasa hispida]
MEEPNLIGEEEEKPCSMENLCRKEKRKALKKIKRKQLRKEVALKMLQEEEARLNDPEEQRRIRLMELEEEERSERERKLFEESERAWMEAMELKKKKMAEEEEEEQQRRALEEESTARQAENENEFNEEDGWEYIEGPAEVIWKGEEIILKKKLIKVPKKGVQPEKSLEDAHRPTSNPLPPQSEAFTDYMNAPISTRQVIEDVASQVPNFGTEQDKSHCPFHLKTGACRFGQRCSRIHFYPDKSCTLLIKNMYNGPGLAWEQDEGLEVC